MTLSGIVDQIVDEIYPWAKPHGQNSWDKDQLGQPAPTGELGQPAPTGELGQPAPTGTGELGQPLPSLDAPPAQKTGPAAVTTAARGNYETFWVPVSNVRPLPDDLDKLSLLLDVTVTPDETPHYCAINFMAYVDEDPSKLLETYIISMSFRGYNQPIHFSQKYKKAWDPVRVSDTTFTLKEATYDYKKERKLRIVVNYRRIDGEDTYFFSFLSEDGQWLTHSFQPGYKITHLYRYGSKNAGECPLDNDLTVTPLPVINI